MCIVILCDIYSTICIVLLCDLYSTIVRFVQNYCVMCRVLLAGHLKWPGVAGEDEQ